MNQRTQNEDLLFAEWQFDVAAAWVSRAAIRTQAYHLILAASAYAGDGAVWTAIDRGFEALSALKKRRPRVFNANSDEERAIDLLIRAISRLQIERDRRQVIGFYPPSSNCAPPVKRNPAARVVKQ
jgi:hypothetical protein